MCVCVLEFILGITLMATVSVPFATFIETASPDEPIEILRGRLGHVPRGLPYRGAPTCRGKKRVVFRAFLEAQTISINAPGEFI